MDRTAPLSQECGAPDGDTARLRLFVPDIHCARCVETIRAGLLAEDGIETVTGEPEAKTIDVTYRPSATSPHGIETAVAELGFNARAPEAA